MLPIVYESVCELEKRSLKYMENWTGIDMGKRIVGVLAENLSLKPEYMQAGRLSGFYDSAIKLAIERYVYEFSNVLRSGEIIPFRMLSLYDQEKIAKKCALAAMAHASTTLSTVGLIKAKDIIIGLVKTEVVSTAKKNMNDRKAYIIESLFSSFSTIFDGMMKDLYSGLRQ